MNRWLPLSVLAVLACGDDSPGSEPDAGPPETAMVLDFAPAPGTSFLARVRLTPPSSDAPTFGATGASVEPPVLVDDHWEASILPVGSSGEVAVTATHGDTAVTRTAVVLPMLGDGWGQPERVPGLVNTPGWEDSVEISPDGEWLVVGTYSPVDLLACLAGGIGAGGDPEDPRCNTAPGPTTAPERPEMPGAGRISAGAIRPDCAAIGVGAIGTALPPVAAYGFHRQPDGSFAEPFLIALAIDGCTIAPFGFSFAEAPTDGRARLLASYDSPAGADTGNDLWTMEIALGAPVTLGAFDLSTGSPTETDFQMSRVLAIAGGQGNPYPIPGGVLFDDEGGSERLFVAYAEGPGFADPQRLPTRSEGLDAQPFLANGRLYWSEDFARIVSAPWADPADPASLGASRVELAADPVASAGRVASVGETSLTADGVLYFVYTVRTETGFDPGVARVAPR